MNPFVSRTWFFTINILLALIIFNPSRIIAADGKKWDGKAYPFKALDPSQPNSESNPFIIDTAGKLEYLRKLANAQDLEGFGKENGIKGLNWGFKDNFVKLTTDLDMNGALYEFVPIPGNFVNFDGGGHVINNLRISDKKTEPYLDESVTKWKIDLALFSSAESIKNLGIGKGSTITYNSKGYVSKGHTYILSVSAASIATDVEVMDGCHSDATVMVKGRCEAFVGGVATNCRYKMTNTHFGGTIIVEGDMIDEERMNRFGMERPGDLLVGGVCARPGNSYHITKKNGGIFNTYNTGSIAVKVSGNELQIGGVAAITGSRCECIDNYNTGKVTVSATGTIKTGYIGGVLGTGYTSQKPNSKPYIVNDSGKIYNTGDINVSLKSGTKIVVGGISGGDNRGLPFSSYTFGGVYGFINTCNSGSISVASTETVETLDVGGIVGFGCMVFNSYNTGNITCESGTGTNLNVGGIGGGAVYAQNCYSIGAMSGKGSGKNMVGGVIGLANSAWGEDESHRFFVTSVFWLKQQQSGEIDNAITYGKGSYSYKPEKSEPTLNDLLGSFGKKKKSEKPAAAPAPTDKTNAGKMVEDSHLGAVYTFENATASILARSDDGPGKKKAYEGTLLQALNATALKNADRKFRLWKIDGSNGGYPVLK